MTLLNHSTIASVLLLAAGVRVCAQELAEPNGLLPEISLETSGLPLTCREPVARLTARLGDCSEADFWWQDAHGEKFHGPFLQTKTPGVYRVFAQIPGSNSLFEKEVVVADGRVFPKVVALGGQLTCREPLATLHTAALPPNVQFAWTGPDGFAENMASPTVEQPGLYQLTATEPQSGCTMTDTAWVVDKRLPPTAEAHASGQLDCEHREIWLSAKGSSAGRAYLYFWWSANGQEVFPNDSVACRATRPDKYTLLVINNLTGCRAYQTVELLEQGNSPYEVSFKIQPPTCDEPFSGILTVHRVSGGIQPLAFSLDGGAFQTSPEFGQLPAGEHNLTVRDAAGCLLKKRVAMPEPMPPRSDFGFAPPLNLPMPFLPSEQAQDGVLLGIFEPIRGDSADGGAAIFLPQTLAQPGGCPTEKE